MFQYLSRNDLHTYIVVISVVAVLVVGVLISSCTVSRYQFTDMTVIALTDDDASPSHDCHPLC